MKKLLILLTLSTLLIPSIILSQDPPEEFQYEQSTLQAFYFFTQVTLNGNLLESNDWVAAFNGDICVGSRQWDVSNCGGNFCDVPAMGYDGAESHLGYMELGDLPTFKIFDTSSGNIYDAIPSQAVDPWSINNFSMNDLLEGFIPGCTDNMACNYNTEATQDDDSCAYEYDCTGECGGDSTVDMCGTCDNNPSNNCTQDCLGDWGGLVVNDECGACGGPGAIYECGCEDIADLYPGFIANQHHIAGGNQHSLALTASGEVVAWGRNDYSQTDIPDNLTDVVAIAGGFYHSLALTASGEVVGWGRNTYGQTDIPDNLSDVVAIAGGDFHSLALTASGEVIGWGRNNDGQTDIPDNLTDVVAIAGGFYYSLALTASGEVVAWGLNDYGQTDIPDNLTDVVAIAGGARYSFALTASGEVVAWGRNTYGQTDIPDNLTDVIAIAGGNQHSLALTASGEVVAWGRNNDGQTDIPDNLTDVVAIAGNGHSLALTASGEVIGWGRNTYGQTDIPDNLEGLVYSDACDCDGNIEDCFGECGGIAEEDCAGDCEGDSEFLTYCADTDGDGLGNPGSETDLCNGLIDETWVFNCDDPEPDCITDDTYICGACGVGIEEGACDCEGNILDACGICNGEEECFIYSRDLHVGSNLISFWALPADTSIENVMSSLEGNVIGVIGEGIAASQINPGQWIGSLTGVEYTSGYWVKLDNDESILTLEGYLNENTLYDLQIGTNLISYPFPDTMGIAESIPDVMEGYFTGIIGEGVATSQIEPFTWVGSLTEFRGGNGYWAKVTFPFEFNFNIPDELSRESIISNNIKELPIWIDFNQSTEQAFYFIEDIEIIELGDIVSSYCNNTKVGSRVWNGAYTDIPAMGNDNSDLTKDYCTSSSVPEFRVEKVNGETYALTGDIPLWESNGLHILSTLQEIIILPESYSLAAAYPNPFNPTTTINFAIPSDTEVSISVYNLHGRDVVTLANGSYDAGYHSVIWNADSYSSGVYFVRMIAGNFISTKKLILLK